MEKSGQGTEASEVCPQSPVRRVFRKPGSVQKGAGTGIKGQERVGGEGVAPADSQRTFRWLGRKEKKEKRRGRGKLFLAGKTETREDGYTLKRREKPWQQPPTRGLKGFRCY